MPLLACRQPPPHAPPLAPAASFAPVLSPCRARPTPSRGCHLLLRDPREAGAHDAVRRAHDLRAQLRVALDVHVRDARARCEVDVVVVAARVHLDHGGAGHHHDEVREAGAVHAHEHRGGARGRELRRGVERREVDEFLPTFRKSSSTLKRPT